MQRPHAGAVEAQHRTLVEQPRAPAQAVQLDVSRVRAAPAPRATAPPPARASRPARCAAPDDGCGAPRAAPRISSSGRTYGPSPRCPPCAGRRDRTRRSPRTHRSRPDSEGDGATGRASRGGGGVHAGALGRCHRGIGTGGSSSASGPEPTARLPRVVASSRRERTATPSPSARARRRPRRARPPVPGHPASGRTMVRRGRDRSRRSGGTRSSTSTSPWRPCLTCARQPTRSALVKARQHGGVQCSAVAVRQPVRRRCGPRRRAGRPIRRR